MKKAVALFMILCVVIHPLTAAAGQEDQYTIATPLFPAFADEDKHAMLEDLLGVTLTVLDLGGAQYEYQRNLLLTSGSEPDLFSVSDLSDEVLQTAAPITLDEIRTYMPDLYEAMLRRAQDSGVSLMKLLKSWSIDGEIRCFSPGKVQNTLPKGIIIRTDVLETLGFDMPRSISDWNQLLLAYKAAKPEAYPIACIGDSEIDAFSMFLSSYGIVRDQWIYQSGLLQYAPFMLGMRDGLKQLAQWYRDGLIDPLYFEYYSRDDYERESFAQGNTFFLTGVPLDTTLNPPYEEGSVLARVAQNDPAAAFVWAPYPYFDSQGHVTVASEFSLSGPYLCFGGHLRDEPEKKHRLMQFVNRLLSDPEAYRLYRTGVDANADESRLLALYGEDGYLEPVPHLSLQLLSPALRQSLAELLREDGLYSRNSLNYLDGPKLTGAFANAAGVDFAVKNETYLTQWNAFFTSIVIGLNTLESFDSFILTWKRSIGFDMMETANGLYLSNWIR